MKSYKLLLAIFILFMASSSAIAIKEHKHATDSKDPEIRNKALASKIWWNQKRKIEKIKITENQRKKMDKILINYLQDQPKDVAAEKKAFKDLAKALTNEGREKTKVQRNKVIKTTSDSVKRQIDMMFDVVSVLTVEQKAAIAQEYPALMSRLWIRSANPAAFRIGKTEGKRNARKGKKKDGHSGHNHSH